MEFARDEYIRQLEAVRGNGLVKIITGVRRCGKSYLMLTLYCRHLRKIGVAEDHIVAVQLDDDEAFDLRKPRKLSTWIKSRLPGDGAPTYVFIDEIQMCKPPKGAPKGDLTFYDVLNSLMKKPGVDVYVTGSNSEMLSKDVATNFRDRGVEIRVWPLSYGEYLAASGLEKMEAWDRYLTWGGLPLCVLAHDDKGRMQYLKTLFQRIYLKDIVERYSLTDDGYMLSALVDVMASDIGCLTNPNKLAAAALSEAGIKISPATIAKYLGHLVDSFLFNKADRWDVKGKRAMSYPSKYYAVDLGLRNARLNFRQVEPSHLMENAIYNELLRRGYGVDVGVVETVGKDASGKSLKRQTEIDFIANIGSTKVYIQSAYAIPNQEKRNQETCSLRHCRDFFKKIVVENGIGMPKTDDNGIIYVGAIPFLLNPGIVE